jgi:formylglycine-generating enzyme required for sulfatase activity
LNHFYFTDLALTATMAATLSLACGNIEDDDPISFPNPKGVNWILIHGGTFSMGSTDWADEQPVHQVAIASFQMTQSEITVAQYRECVEANVCSEPDSGGAYENWNEPGYENHPVNAMDWYQARAFCRWIGGDLPSESMWEYAAKSGGKQRLFPWGDKAPNCDRAVMDSNDHVDGCGTERTWPVCSKPSGNTIHGLCDMAGNVWEWVLDWYHGAYDCDQDTTEHNCEQGGKAATDGSAWGETGTFIVERGGSFNSDAFYLRAAARLRVSPTKRSYGLGFRCARTAKQ